MRSPRGCREDGRCLPRERRVPRDPSRVHTYVCICVSSLVARLDRGGCTSSSSKYQKADSLSLPPLSFSIFDRCIRVNLRTRDRARTLPRESFQALSLRLAELSIAAAPRRAPLQLSRAPGSSSSVVDEFAISTKLTSGVINRRVNCIFFVSGAPKL